ncbi:hypothetical protein [Pelagicoccus mobilis]|uniref:Uncharacterized protein n=1 Tax=Pelagicoccus mobilis TaxID=415221 RepID=A0A934S3B1_9BACT|nr:hypothetical protein [Pelagicoccus mobilis]MBK1879886.1 hypothetical protein [Pelagicoccus mobilis]
MSNPRPWHTPLSSLVVTLSQDVELAADAERVIREHKSISTAPREGIYLPVLIEHVDARPLHDWLEALAGVQQVDVAFVSTETPR